jgi:hypothetical protein
LDCSASVEEVLASDQRVRIQPGSTPLHFLVADRTGRSAVVEFLGGQLVCHTGSSLPVAALTNDTYDASLAYAGLVPPEWADHVSSLGRFVQAAASVRNFTQSSVPDPIAYAFAALANVNQPGWTRWSIVYDIGNLTAYFRTLPAPAIKQIRLDRLDFRPSAPIRMMDINAYTAGEVSPQLIYSAADNLAVLTSVYRQTTPLASVSASSIQRRAAYPDSVAPAALPVVSTQPQSRTVGLGEPVELSVAASSDATVQWCRNGQPLSGATDPALRIDAVQPADVGLYTALLSNAASTTTSEPAIVGLTTSAKVLGSGYEYAGNIHHAVTGNTYDQFLLTGSAASITADPGQISRISFVDLDDDIVQVEFSGSGTLTLLLDAATGPATPVKYSQDIPYMRGHATVVLAGASADTQIAIFSVGSLTNPGVLKPGELYEGHANLAALAIQSRDGRLGAIRCGNATFSASSGTAGVLAPGVTVDPGPVNLHDICAADSAAACLSFGSAPLILITGGELHQINGGAIKTTGISAGGIALVAGTSSANVAEPARPLRGRIEREGLDASGDLVTN